MQYCSIRKDGHMVLRSYERMRESNQPTTVEGFHCFFSTYGTYRKGILHWFGSRGIKQLEWMGLLQLSYSNTHFGCHLWLMEDLRDAYRNRGRKWSFQNYMSYMWNLYGSSHSCFFVQALWSRVRNSLDRNKPKPLKYWYSLWLLPSFRYYY